MVLFTCTVCITNVWQIVLSCLNTASWPDSWPWSWKFTQTISLAQGSIEGILDHLSLLTISMSHGVQFKKSRIQYLLVKVRQLVDHFFVDCFVSGWQILKVPNPLFRWYSKTHYKVTTSLMITSLVLIISVSLKPIWVFRQAWQIYLYNGRLTKILMTCEVRSTLMIC